MGDKDKYTTKLSNKLKESFQYMVDHAQNSYIGVWHDMNNNKVWETLVKNKVNWCNYHSIIIDKKNDYEKLNLYKCIKNSNKKKIVIRKK